MTIQATTISTASTQAAGRDGWQRLYQLAGWVAVIQLVYALVTMVLLMAIGGPPETVRAAFDLLQQNKLVGLLRLDILVVLFVPLYYLLLLGLYAGLKKTDNVSALIIAALGFAGVTLVLATPSVLSWLTLSDKFAAATSAEQKTLLLAAGEAILASDMWHGSGAFVGGMLQQTSLLLASIVMLRSPAFGKATAYVGIVMHGLDLLHIPLLLIFPIGGVISMSIAGTLYLAWFPLLARDFFRLGRNEISAGPSALQGIRK